MWPTGHWVHLTHTHAYSEHALQALVMAQPYLLPTSWTVTAPKQTNLSAVETHVRSRECNRSHLHLMKLQQKTSMRMLWAWQRDMQTRCRAPLVVAVQRSSNRRPRGAG